MVSRLFRGTAVSLVVAFIATAFAQYGYQPFFDQPLIQSRAYGMELILVRLRAIDQFDAPLDDDLMELIELIGESDVNRFIGTLRAADPELADELLDEIEELEEKAEEGRNHHGSVREVRELTERAYDLIIPSQVRKSPAFLAALIADLTLGEGGIAEGYEEAIGDEEPFLFTGGWSSLQSVKELWSQLTIYATPAQAADVNEMLAQLDDIYFSPEPPEPLVGNPEEAEAPAQRMLGLIEPIADAEVFAGRDMQALAVSLVATQAQACRAYDAGNDEVGLEGVYAVGEMYARYLAGFLGFMAPDVHEEAAETIYALTGIQDEGAEDEEDEDDEDERPEVADPAGACRELLEALEEAVEVLGG